MTPIDRSIRLHITRGASALLVCGALTACGTTEPDTATLEGVWRLTVPSEYESTVTLGVDGTLDAIEANLASQTCSHLTGTWSSDASVLSVDIDVRNGGAVSEHEDIPFELTTSTLTLNYVGDDPETYSRFGATIGCASYGWPSITLYASIDGVRVDFEDHFAPLTFPGETLADLIAAGGFTLSGRNGSGALPADCMGCQELSIEATTVAPLVVGTYGMDGTNLTGREARGSYSPDLSASTDYVTDGSDPVVQPWQGEVVLTTVSATELSGTFEFVGYDQLDPGPVRPSVTVTNGVFRIAFE